MSSLLITSGSSMRNTRTIWQILAFLILSQIMIFPAYATWSTVDWEANCKIDPDKVYDQLQGALKPIRQALARDNSLSPERKDEILKEVMAGDFSSGYEVDPNLPAYLVQLTKDHSRYQLWRDYLASNLSVTPEELDAMMEAGMGCFWLSNVLNAPSKAVIEPIGVDPALLAAFELELEEVSQYLSNTGTRESMVKTREAPSTQQGDPPRLYRLFSIIPNFQHLGSFSPCWNDAPDDCERTLQLSREMNKDFRSLTIAHELFHSILNNSRAGRIQTERSIRTTANFLEEGLAEAFGVFWFYGKKQGKEWGVPLKYWSFYNHLTGAPDGITAKADDGHLNLSGAYERTDTLAYENALFFLAMAHYSGSHSAEWLARITDHPWFDEIKNVAQRERWNQKILTNYLRTEMNIGPLEAQARAVAYLTQPVEKRLMEKARRFTKRQLNFEDVVIDLTDKGRAREDRTFENLSHLRSQGSLFMVQAYNKPMRIHVTHNDPTPTQRVVVNGEVIDGTWTHDLKINEAFDVYVAGLSGKGTEYDPNHEEAVSISIEITEEGVGTYDDCPGDPNYSFFSIGAPGGTSGTVCALATHDVRRNALSIHLFRTSIYADSLTIPCRDDYPKPDPKRLQWHPSQAAQLTVSAPLPGQRPADWTFEGPGAVDPEGPKGMGWEHRFPEPGMILKARISHSSRKSKCLEKQYIYPPFEKNIPFEFAPQLIHASRSSSPFISIRPHDEEEVHPPYWSQEEINKSRKNLPGPAPANGTLTIDKISSGMIEGTFEFPTHEVYGYNGKVFGDYMPKQHNREILSGSVTGRFRATYRPAIFNASAFPNAGKFNRTKDENGKMVCKAGDVEKGAIGTKKMKWVAKVFEPKHLYRLLRANKEEGREAFELARTLIRSVRQSCGPGKWFSDEWIEYYLAFEAVYAPRTKALEILEK